MFIYLRFGPDLVTWGKETNKKIGNIPVEVMMEPAYFQTKRFLASGKAAGPDEINK